MWFKEIEKQDKIIILGAGGRDFFMMMRNIPCSLWGRKKVVAFVATQIPGIDNRIFPARLAGLNYPDGIPIRPMNELEKLIIIEQKKADTRDVFVELDYSDISDQEISEIKKRVESCGAEFIVPQEWLYKALMLWCRKPIIAVTAVRTGCGKSAVTRYIAKYLRYMGFNPIVVRHPMPYFNLNDSRNDVQRFASLQDIDGFKCTLEEREEYEPLIDAGFVVYAGVDYEKILRAAESEGDVIIWDGGNNDLPFFKPDLWITVTDPHRVGDEISYPHGFWNLKNADIVLINKAGNAKPDDMELLKNNIDKYRKSSKVLVGETDMEITVENPEFLKGKYVIAVEDGPTVTHGGMRYGAAVLAAEKYGAILADPRPYLDESLRKVFDKYPHLWDTKILPCMGYSQEEIEALEKTIKVTPADAILCGSPIDLGRVIKSFADEIFPIIRVEYELIFLRITSGSLFETEILNSMCE